MDVTFILILTACLVCTCAETCTDYINQCRDTYYSSLGTSSYLRTYIQCVEAVTCTNYIENSQKQYLVDSLRTSLNNLECSESLSICYTAYGNVPSRDQVLSSITCLSKLTICQETSLNATWLMYLESAKNSLENFNMVTCSSRLQACANTFYETHMTSTALETAINCIMALNCTTAKDVSEKNQALQYLYGLMYSTAGNIGHRSLIVSSIDELNECYNGLNRCSVLYGNATDKSGMSNYISCLSGLTMCMYTDLNQTREGLLAAAKKLIQNYTVYGCSLKLVLCYEGFNGTTMSLVVLTHGGLSIEVLPTSFIENFRKYLDVYYRCVAGQNCVNSTESAQKDALLQSIQTLLDNRCQTELNVCYLTFGNSTDRIGLVNLMTCLSGLSKCTNPTITQLIETLMNSSTQHIQSMDIYGCLLSIQSCQESYSQSTVSKKDLVTFINCVRNQNCVSSTDNEQKTLLLNMLQTQLNSMEDDQNGSMTSSTGQQRWSFAIQALPALIIAMVVFVYN